MHYYPHNIGDFNQATRHLTRLERSIYRDLIDLYYDTESQISLDIKLVCRKIIALTEDESTAVEQTLNEFFTLTPIGYYNDRCEHEIESYRATTSQKSLAGKASAAKRANKLQQALNEIPTAVEQTLNGTSTKQELINNNQELIKSLEQNNEKLKTTKGSRLSTDFVIPDDWFTIAASINKTLTKGEIIIIADSFKDYWVSLAGSKAVKLDWVATWRNWIRSHRPTNKSFSQQRDESRTIAASSIFKDKYIAEQTGNFLESNYEKLN